MLPVLRLKLQQSTLRLFSDSVNRSLKKCNSHHVMQIVHLQVTGSKGRSPPAFARPATGLYTNVCDADYRLTRM